MKLFIISGLSGAGKSIALQALEDLDYYCVDNLPLALLPAFARQMLDVAAEHPSQATAVGIDARNLSTDLKSFDQVLEDLRALGMEYEIVFLEASDEVLLQRFSETRRKHPLTDEHTPLREAIRRERALLENVYAVADLRIDTTRSTVHQLRDQVRRRVARKKSSQMSILFLSFGYKNGVPVDADYLFDVRCLPNPHWDPRLRLHDGRHPAVAAFLDEQEEVESMFKDICGFLQRWLPRFAAENRSYLTVAIGCTGGQHRSVYMVERLAAHFRDACESIQIRHRDVT
ncbi:MAG TPA: RNase adapter RapZ [Gammaproteobacteria bacterium]|nr:RNase adapter RapZ [Gammaproteobacteria bacterium]